MLLNIKKRNELSKMKADQETIDKVKPFKTYKSYVLEQKSSNKKKS